MLRGVDISSWQGDIDLLAIPELDFAIIKATEGTGYVNPYCDRKVQQCVRGGKLWGFYHYLTIGSVEDAVKQADYFYENCKNYFGAGIPCVDWEGNGSPSSYYGNDAVNAFVDRIYELTGVWCWIYSWPSWFNKGGVRSNCGRWVASYAPVINPDFSFSGDAPKVEGLLAAWQYASDGRLPGFSGDLDLNIFYGNASAWKAYALGTRAEPNAPKDDLDVIYDDIQDALKRIFNK